MEKTLSQKLWDTERNSTFFRQPTLYLSVGGR